MMAWNVFKTVLFDHWLTQAVSLGWHKTPFQGYPCQDFEPYGYYA
jgi:hypothetical protein